MGLRLSERTLNPFPERIGRYELLLPIGTGGMATVFLGRATGVGGFERDVAVKVIHAHLRTDEESKQLLLEEARLAARIRHANVVPVLEVGDDPFGIYLVLDYVEGDSLAGLMREVKASGQKIPLPIVARILLDALEGLHAAHELRDESGNPLGLVHRDFSPQNILVGVDGVSKLADFSVAKSADRAIRTRTGLVKGKIGYMSPEQARGHPVDRRCDVWAAGVVAWELVAWRRLHKNSDAVATLLNIVTEAPPLLGDVMPGAPKAVEEAIHRALAMDATARIPTALALRKELDLAFRAIGPIADAPDVGEYVARIFGGKLRERSTHAAEIQKLRRQMHEITRPAVADALGPTTESAPESGQRTRADIPSVIGVRTPGGTASTGAGVTAPPERGELADLESGSAFSPARRTRARNVILGAVGTVVALVAALALGRRTHDPVVEAAPLPRTDPPSVATAPNVPVAPVEPEAPSASAVEAPGGTAKPGNDAPKAARTGAVSNTPLRARPRRSASAAPSATAVAAPKSKAPVKLARDPYGGAP